MHPSKSVLTVAVLAALTVACYGQARGRFQTDLINSADTVIRETKGTVLKGSYHHINYILLNANSITQRTTRARNQTRNQINTVGSSYISALNVDKYYNGGKVKQTFDVAELVKKAEQQVYPKFPEFKSDQEEMVKLHAKLLAECNVLNGFSSANIAAECQNDDDNKFESCLAEKVVVYNATANEFFKRVREGARTSIDRLRHVDDVYDAWLENGIKDLTEDLTLQSNQWAESVYAQGNTSKYILGFGKMHVEATLNTYLPTVEALAKKIGDTYTRVERYFETNPNSFSADVFRSRVDASGVTGEIKTAISMLEENKRTVQSNALKDITNKYVLFFKNTVDTYDDSLEIIHQNSEKNKSRAAEIKAENGPSKFDKIDTTYLDCYNASSTTPNENLMTCLNDKRYAVKVELVRITEYLQMLYQEVLPLSVVPFLELQNQFLRQAESVLSGFLASLKN